MSDYRLSPTKGIGGGGTKKSSTTSSPPKKSRQSLKRTASKLIRKPFRQTEKPKDSSGSGSGGGDSRSSLVSDNSDESLGGLDDTRRKLPPLLLSPHAKVNQVSRSSSSCTTASKSGSLNREKKRNDAMEDSIGLDGTRRNISLLDLLGPAGGGGAIIANTNGGGTMTNNENKSVLGQKSILTTIVPVILKNARTEEADTLNTKEETLRGMDETKRQFNSNNSLDKEMRGDSLNRPVIENKHSQQQHHQHQKATNSCREGLGGFIRTHILTTVCSVITFTYHCKNIIFRPSSNGTNHLLEMSQIAMMSILFIGLLLSVTKASPGYEEKSKFINK